MQLGLSNLESKVAKLTLSSGTYQHVLHNNKVHTCKCTVLADTALREYVMGHPVDGTTLKNHIRISTKLSNK